MADSLLQTNILPPELIKPQRKVTIQHQFTQIVSSAVSTDRLRSPGDAKNLTEFYDLVRYVINDSERRANVINDGKVFFTEEDPDALKDNNIIISFGVEKRMPGAFSKGAPFEGDIANQKPMLREDIEDPENPGYRRAILGYWHDNEIRFTVWARTNKVANEKALWFENIMQEYSWYFTSQGVVRVIFMKRDSDFVTDINGAKMYGRPLHYFVRTETLRTVSEKVIEEIIVNASVSDGLA